MVSDLDDQVPCTKRDATSPLAPDCVKFAAMCGLSAAATKAKLLSDHEEREVQRLAATIINHQVCLLVFLFISSVFQVLEKC